MMAKKPKPITLSNPMPIRVMVPDEEVLKRVSASTGVPVSVLARMAIKLGLPILRKQLEGAGGAGNE